MGRGKSLGSLKLFLPYVPQLCGARILSFLLSLISPLGVDAAVDCEIVGILFLSWVPSGLSIRAARMWWFEVCNNLYLLSCCFLVTQSCLSLREPMDSRMPGFPVHHHLPEFALTHVHWVSDAIQPSHPVIPFSSCPQSFPASGSFQMSQLFASDGQSIGVSASTSVLPMNTQDWSPQNGQQ